MRRLFTPTALIAMCILQTVSSFASLASLPSSSRSLGAMRYELCMEASHFAPSMERGTAAYHDNVIAISLVGNKSPSRREMLRAFSASAIAATISSSDAAEAANEKENLQQRFEGNLLPQLPADLRSNDDIPYPTWMEGTWLVQAKMTAWSAPMGNKFLGGRTPDVNEKSAAEARGQVGSENKYLLRFEAGPNGKIREDRVFNTQQRLDSYAGRKITRRVEYVPLDRGGKTKDLNTITYFKGGLVGKVFSTRRRWDTSPDGSSFICDEGKRELYGKRCEQSVEARVCPPPITTDQEVVSEYRLLEDGQIQARIRLAGYLNPNDVLFFASEQKAVTLSDYSLVLKKVPPVQFEAPPPAQ